MNSIVCVVRIVGNEWVIGIPDGFAPVKVRVTDMPVEHEVKMKDFKQWIERRGNIERRNGSQEDSGNIGLPKSL